MRLRSSAPLRCAARGSLFLVAAAVVVPVYLLPPRLDTLSPRPAAARQAADAGRPAADEPAADRHGDDKPGGRHPPQRPFLHAVPFAFVRGGGSRAPGPGDTSYALRMARKYPLAPDLEASGRFHTVAGHRPAPGRGTVVRYRIDVEVGLPLSAALFAEAVHRTLDDERSWGGTGRRTFEQVESGADFAVTLASPGTTARWCAKSDLDTADENVSCDSAATERVLINAYRWARGARSFGSDMLGYRRMLINHEVGHRLGRGHEFCAEDGALAPVMMQQTKTLTTGTATCRPNPWPYPDRGREEDR